MTCSSLFRSLTAAALAVSVTLPAGAQSVVGKDKTVPVPNPVNLDTTGMFQAKFVSVGDDMFIGGQPTEKALRELRANGVTTLVNLRMPEAMASADAKVLLHCTIAWRASHLWAAYLIRERKTPVATALLQARSINLMDDMRMGGDQQPLE